MGNRLIIKRASSLPIAGNDLVTIVSAANRRVRLIEVAVAAPSTGATKVLFYWVCRCSWGFLADCGDVRPHGTSAAGKFILYDLDYAADNG